MSGKIIKLLLVGAAISTICCSQSNKCPSSVCNVDKENLKFFILGDWGGDNSQPFTTQIQRNIAKGMNNLAVSENVDFYLSTGDHFYHYGVNDVEDPRFKVTFEDVFNKPGHQKLWHMSAGNHDYYKNISAQIAYSKKSWRWNFPHLYYTIKYQTKRRSIADFIVIDTIVLCGNTRDTADERPKGPDDLNLAKAHWQWIDKQLDESKAPYLFIVGHYPPRSKGRHGPTTACFVDRIENLMRKYNVSVFLAGHDHNLQHYRYTAEDGRKFEYVVSGLGALYNDIQSADTHNGGKSLFFYPDTRRDQTNALLKETDKGGFVLATLNRSVGTFKFYNGDSIELYSFNVLPRTLYRND